MTDPSKSLGESLDLFSRQVDRLELPVWRVERSGTILERPASTALCDPSFQASVSGLAKFKGENPSWKVLPNLRLTRFDFGNQAVVVEVPIGARDRLDVALTPLYFNACREVSDRSAIDGFNLQLSQSYEEVNFVFRMAKFLTSPGDPRQVVRTMCEDLRDVVKYGWIAAVFDNGPSVVNGLQGVLEISGTVPFGTVSFHADAMKLAGEDVGKVLTPRAHHFAARAGSEVLVERVLHGQTVIGVVVAGNRQGDDPDVSSNEIQLIEAAANFLGLYHQNAFRFVAQQKQFLGTLHALSAAVDAKDPYTQGHSQRVAMLAQQVALKLGLPTEQADAYRVAGLLHDIGKIGIPESVLRKPARLSDAEFEIIKKHPEIGHHILKEVPSLDFHLPGVLHHHERWDGRGYPAGLSGQAIPLLARVLAFADTFDAMSSNRAYRGAMDRERVFQEIRKSAGTQFDPQLVEVFVALDFTEFDRMVSTSAAQASHELKQAA